MSQRIVFRPARLGRLRLPFKRVPNRSSFAAGLRLFRSADAVLIWAANQSSRRRTQRGIGRTRASALAGPFPFPCRRQIPAPRSRRAGAIVPEQPCPAGQAGLSSPAQDDRPRLSTGAIERRHALRWGADAAKRNGRSRRCAEGYPQEADAHQISWRGTGIARVKRVRTCRALPDGSDPRRAA